MAERFEYDITIEQRPNDTPLAMTIAELNARGSQGWELVHYYTRPSGMDNTWVYRIWKRRLDA
jgi:hypothetical protein